MSRKQKRAPFVHDPKIHCPHKWTWLDGEDARRKEFERVCVPCGAGSTLNDRRQVVAYDRDWNGGAKRKDLPDDVREPENDRFSPVTWEDGLAS